MVLTAALIPLAVAVTPAAPQPPPDQPPAYTLSGVRRAAAEAGTPGADQSAAPAQPADQPARPLVRRTPQGQINVETFVPPPTRRPATR